MQVPSNSSISTHPIHVRLIPLPPRSQPHCFVQSSVVRLKAQIRLCHLNPPTTREQPFELSDVRRPPICVDSVRQAFAVDQVERFRPQARRTSIVRERGVQVPSLLYELLNPVIGVVVVVIVIVVFIFPKKDVDTSDLNDEQSAEDHLPSSPRYPSLGGWSHCSPRTSQSGCSERRSSIHDPLPNPQSSTVGSSWPLGGKGTRTVFPIRSLRMRQNASCRSSSSFHGPSASLDTRLHAHEETRRLIAFDVAAETLPRRQADSIPRSRGQRHNTLCSQTSSLGRSAVAVL